MAKTYCNKGACQYNNNTKAHQYREEQQKKPLTDALESARDKIKLVSENLACLFATKRVKDIAGGTAFWNDASEDWEQLIFFPPSSTMRECGLIEK